MSEKKWTPQQQQVIDLRDCNILVSAAAGSGKTAVLVERILSRIMDPVNPVDVDQFVIVTFTNAAAAEMRERIGKAIDKAVTKHPEDAHLRQQVVHLHHAQISTIHSFCGYVIQNYFHRIGIDPSYRLGSEAEMKMLESDVITEILEEHYENADDDFIDLAESYLFDKNDKKMEELIREIYLHAMSEPWPKEWIQRTRESLFAGKEEDFAKCELMQHVMSYLGDTLAELLELEEEAYELCDNPGGPWTYKPAIEDDLNQLKVLVACKDFDELQSKIQSLVFARLSTKKAEDISGEMREIVKAKRNLVKETLKKLAENFLFVSLKEAYEDNNHMVGKLRTLLSLTEEFMERYQKEKRDRGLADFNDLEQMAISILLEERDGEMVPSQAADELAHHFVEIMIDEYQDSNLVQDTILNSISRERFGTPNVFMVGDVKQSIYRFRQARPELFTSKLAVYQTDEGAYRRVDLHKNFRSRELVLNCVNQVFERVMKANLGGIDYDKDASLYLGAEFKESEHKLCNTIEVLNVEESDSACEWEPVMIANRIKELVNPDDPTYIWDEDHYRPVRYHDIVILVRSAVSLLEPLERGLQQQGIPCSSEKKKGFYQSQEISMMVNLFHVLDNPRQDIPLVAVLKSPVADFSDEELARIRCVDREMDFYDDLCKYQEPGELFDKVQKFLTLVEELRAKLSYATVADILQEIYEKTDIYEQILLMPESEQKSANLELLMKQAMDFDRTTYHGLFQFVRYLERIESNQMDAGEANVLGEHDNVVRIVTIHKSKGLEYPICILAGMSRKLGGNNSNWLYIHPDYGIASEAIDNENRVRRNTLARQFLRVANLKEDLGEELRVLYVAMTRAKEKLIFTGSTTKWEDKMSKWFSDSATLVEKMAISNYYDMVMPVLNSNFANQDWLTICNYSKEELLLSKVKDEIKSKISESAFYNFDTNVVYDEEVEKRLTFLENFEYKGVAKEIPVKVSVSDLKKKSLEEDEMPDFHVLEKDTMEEEAPVPAFAREKEAETEGVKGAAYGTIWHQLMSVIDFTKCDTKEDIDKQVTELVACGKITEEDCAVFDSRRLLTFFHSSLGKRMTEAMSNQKLYREQPFVLGVKACEVLADEDSEEMVLVQGIIDGFFEENEEIVLMDYKTDRLPKDGEEILIKRYQVQMQLYKRALEKIVGKHVKECILYSFSLGKEILLPEE